MKRHLRSRRLLAGLSVTALATTGLGLSGAAGAADPAAGVGPAKPEVVHVRLDPSYQQQKFQGWGTSLAWFANATGGMPDEIRNKLADMVFGADGLNLNIARYNIGGGNAPDVKNYLRPGGAVEGWWQAPAGTTRADVDWWDANDPADWNADADRTQRWWIDKIKDRVDTWEAFSNSPPWFMTNSGFVSGGLDSGADQIKESSVEDFTAYLVKAVEELELAHGIKVAAIDPFNEPNTNYWSTQLDAAGNPTGGGQEGAHVSPEMQQKVIRALAARLAGANTDAVISAMDDTNPSNVAKNWNTYPADVRALVAQLNTHTYGTGGRTTVRDLAKAADKPLWMSEFGGSWGNSQNFTSMDSGVGMAQHMIDDLRELEPSAWVFWQPVEDYNNMKPDGQGWLGANWGSIQMPFDCTAADTLATCPIHTNTTYDTVRNFTHSIRPGDHLINVNDTSSVAAVGADGTSATVVHVNHSAATKTVDLDLSGFGRIAPRATVTAVTTSTGGALVKGRPVRITDTHASIQVPGESVTTFLVEGVSGIAKDAPLVLSGHVYRLQGVQSGKSLAPVAAGAAIRSTDPAAADQLWRLTKLARDDSNRARYSVVSATTGRQLAVRDGAIVLEGAQRSPDDAAQWILSTTGDRTWTLVNVASGLLAEVGGQATADGAPVTAYLPGSGPNQRWTIIDETVLRTTPVESFTSPGTAPALPATVAPVFRDGARGDLPVRWVLPSDARWATPGTVQVAGTATDPLGRTVKASATVTVDTIVATLPARAKAYVGGQPVLPATVTGVGASGAEVSLPATWSTAPAGAFDALGVVPLAGVAQVRGADPIAATVRVQVTEPGERNAALDAGTGVTATFTEGGYFPAGVVNGDLTDKAWSNWVPGTKDVTDTLTVTLPRAADLTHVTTHFFLDGGMRSVAQSVRLQLRTPDGGWVDASGDVPVNPDGGTSSVIDLPAAGRTDAVRAVLTARPGEHLTVSEVEVFAKAPGVSADAAAASIAVDGTPIPGFDPKTATYTVDVGRAKGIVTAVAADPYATVSVQQADSSGSTALVTLTSEDGGQVQTYTVHLLR